MNAIINAEAVFMALDDVEEYEEYEESVGDNSEGDEVMYMVNTTPPITTGYVPSYHPGGTTAVQEVTRTVGSWMPTKELPQACQTCTHTWEENSVTSFLICYFCGIRTTDISRLHCPQCKLTACAVCAQNHLKKQVTVKKVLEEKGKADQSMPQYPCPSL